jgi:hypothetical protein
MPSTKPDKPAPITFNVDTWDGDGVTREPFTLALGGKPFTFTPTQELPWVALSDAQELVNTRGEVRPLLRLALGDQFDAFVEASAKLPTRALGEVIARYLRHGGAASPGEPGASSSS